MSAERIRTVYLRPYWRKGAPAFTLTLWDSGRTDWRGQTLLRYRLRQTQAGRAPIDLFEGSDFAGSPLHSDGSDESIYALLGFLTLRPGDTDAEYFDQYTEAQWDFVHTHAEALANEADYRFNREAIERE